MSVASEEDQAMRERIQARFEALGRELETGRAELQQVEARRTYLYETLLRIDGALHELGELLEGEEFAGQNGTASGEERFATVQANRSGV